MLCLTASKASASPEVQLVEPEAAKAAPLVAATKDLPMARGMAMELVVLVVETTN
jgi:hypothetical protein